MKPDVIGWASSLVLLMTLGAQTWKQYHSATTRGVSRWLYVGELGASTGFTVYSALLHNAVFIVTNVLGIATALCGLVIYARNRRREAAAS
jgi:hypothetical protein